MPFLHHLEDLRGCLIRSLVAIAAGVVVSLFFIQRLLHILQWPLERATSGVSVQLRTISVAESFSALVDIAVVAGLMLALPYTLFEVWRFVSPGLTPKERRAVGPLLVLGTFFFFAGVVFTHMLLLPPTLRYFLELNNWLGLAPEWRILDYLKFTLTMLFVSGVLFEIPIVAAVLARFGILSSTFLICYWRQSLVVLLLFAAIITPSTDWYTMMLMCIPLSAMYVISILMAKIFYVPR